MQTPQQEVYTGINFDLGFFPLAFFLYFCKPVVTINGYAQQCSWGTQYFELQPGTYQISIFFPYIFSSQCGLNHTEVYLNHGEVRTVKYFMWPLVFLPGSIQVF